MKDLLIKLAITLRTAQLCSHFYHNIAGRVAFFADHDALSSFYNEYEDSYDNIAERLIGLYGVDALQLHQIMSGVMEKLSKIPPSYKDNGEMFSLLLMFENEITTLSKAICYSQEVTEGTKQLVGDIADKSEVRVYKIKRRIVK